MGIPSFLIASSVIGSMAQRLVRKLCPKCAQNAAPPSEEMINEFVKSLDPIEGNLIKEMLHKDGSGFKVEKGCDNCRGTGYAGRTGIFEIMVMNEELRKQILANSSTDVLRRTALQSGMKSLLMDGISKACAGQTTLSEVIRVTATMV